VLRQLIVTGASLAALLLAPAAASAESLTLQAPASAVEDTAVKIVASGEAVINRRMWVYIEPGEVGCAPTPALQHHRPAAVEHVYRYLHEPNFLDVVAPIFPAPGPQQVCAYIGSAADSAPAATAAAVIAVRAPVVTLSLRQKGRTMRIAGSAETPRRLFVYAAPRGRACAATAELQAARRGAAELLERFVEGTFRETLFRPLNSRLSQICAYAAQNQDAAADARLSLRLRRR
jgi:hypothetical protein